MRYLTATLAFLACGFLHADDSSAMLTDINPGTAGSDPSPILELANHQIVFAAKGTSGVDLWTNTGTLTGTSKVDLGTAHLPYNSSIKSSVLMGTYTGGTLYFLAGTDTTGIELWKWTNGTASLVSDLMAGANSAFSLNNGTGFDGSLAYSAIGSGQKLLFVPMGSFGSNIYLTDGSAPQLVTTGDQPNLLGLDASNKCTFINSNGVYSFDFAQAISTSNPLLISSIATSNDLVHAIQSNDKSTISVATLNKIYGVSGTTVTDLVTVPNTALFQDTAASIGAKTYLVTKPTASPGTGTVDIYEATGSSATKVASLPYPSGSYVAVSLAAAGQNLVVNFAITANSTITTTTYVGSPNNLVNTKTFNAVAVTSFNLASGALVMPMKSISGTGDTGVYAVGTDGTISSLLAGVQDLKTSLGGSTAGIAFWAQTATGWSVYRSTGTSASTVKEAGSYTFPANTDTASISLVSDGTRAYFAAADVDHGAELWLSPSVLAPTNPTSAPHLSDATAALTTISGTGTTGDAITLYDGDSVLASLAVDSSGNWTWTPTTAFTVGTHSITYTESNTAGTTTKSPAATLTVASATESTSSSSDGGSSGKCGLGSAASLLLGMALMAKLKRR
jgi:ELWxxDGT repeat protein